MKRENLKRPEFYEWFRFNEDRWQQEMAGGRSYWLGISLLVIASIALAITILTS